MITIVVDSNAQLPDSLAQRYGIKVVPLTVSVNGVDHLEGVDLTDVDFYRAWDRGEAPSISTSQPSPGQFVEVYEEAIAAGATEILSVHITEAMSGTLNSARIAADSVSVPVRLVDTTTASFGISCCAWAAAEAIRLGAELEMAAQVAEQRAAQIGTAFVVGVPGRLAESGRAQDVDVQAVAAQGIPVLSMSGGQIDVLATAASVDAAVDAMRCYAVGWTPSGIGGLRVAVGTSDATSAQVSAALTEVLRKEPSIAEIVQYTIGPSVGAHTGPGTAGLFVF